jgi:predicted nuclease with TOPRIM domain
VLKHYNKKELAMPTDPTMLWNAILSLAAGGFMWWMRGVTQQMLDIKRRMSDTREELPKIYATRDELAKEVTEIKAEMQRDMEKLLGRFDRMENKLDSLLAKFVTPQ